MIHRAMFCLLIAASLWSAEVAPTGGTPAERRWFDFTPNEQWGVWWNVEKMGPIVHRDERIPDGLAITLTAHDKALRLPIVTDRRVNDRADAAVTALTMIVTQEVGEGLAVSLRLVDAQNEWFDVATRPLIAGRNELHWSLPADVGKGWNGEPADGKITKDFWIWEVVLHAAPTSTEAKVRIESLDTMGETLNAAAQVEVRLESSQPGFLVAPGEALPELVLHNRWKVAAPVTLNVELEEFDGAKRTHAATVVLPTAGAARWRIPAELSGSRLGIRWLRWAINGGPKGREHYAVIQPPGRAPAGYTGFHFGVNGVNGEALAAIAERVGITLNRGGWQWAMVQPEKDLPPAQWKWNAEGGDDNLAILERHGIASHGIVGYNAMWNAPEAAKQAHLPLNPKGTRQWDLIFTYPEDLDAYRTYVREFMQRYSKRLWSCSPWNEPGWYGDLRNHPEWYDNGRFLKMQQIVFEEARRANPALKVGTGGFANVSDPVGLQKQVIRDGQAWYDLHVTHEHSHWDYFTYAVGATNDWRREFGATDKPFLFDETAKAMHKNTPWHEMDVSHQLVRMTPYVWLNGAVGHCWFELGDAAYMHVAGDDEKDTDPGWERWGMIDKKMQPRAATAVFAAQVGQLRGKRCLGQLPTDNNSYAIVFGDDVTKPGEQVIARWIHPEGRAEQAYVVNVAGATAVHSIDIMGNPSPVAIRDGLAPVVLTRQPGWLNLTGTKAPATVGGRLLRVVGPLIVEPSDAVIVEVTNPTRTTTTAELGFVGAAGRKVELAPGATVRVALPTPLVTRDAAPSAVQWKFPALGDGWKGSLIVPLTAALVMPATAADGRVADFTSGQKPEQVDNRFTMLLGADHLRWQGPKDCSVQTWFTLVGEDLVLRADVLDDVHQQPHAGGEMWRADSIQFAIDQPGWNRFWEFGVCLRADGKVDTYQWQQPAQGGNVLSKLSATVVPITGGLRYEARISIRALALDRAKLAGGFRFNLVVNDLDEVDGTEKMREGVVFLAPGLHAEKHPSKWILLRLKSESK